jgi:cytochrome P450
MVAHTDIHWSYYFGAALVAVTVYLNYTKKRSDLSHIPIIAPKTPLSLLSYYLGAAKFAGSSYPIFEEGYTRFKNGVFRIPSFYGWWVVVSGPQLTEELRTLPEEVASLIDLVNHTLEVRYTMGHSIATNPYHVPIIKGQLTRSLPALYHEIQDEVQVALTDYLKPDGEDTEWKAVNGQEFVTKVVARATNRLFVGLPLCRKQDFLDICMGFAKDVVVVSTILQMFPKFLKPFAARFFTSIPTRVRKVAKYIRPVVDERKAAIAQHGSQYPGKRNDMLSWLIDNAEGPEQELHNLALRILVMNFAGLHTTSMTFLHAFYDLLQHPECVEPLREEILRVTGTEGFTKITMTKLVKMDSFFKESMRMNSISCLGMHRLTKKTFTFSDGTVIPAGTFICTNSLVHRDPDAFGPTALQFDPARFEKDANDFAVTTSNKFLQFGHGVHACPGRFFAVNDMKIILCELLMNYDFKLEGDAKERPKDFRIGTTNIPNGEAKILFRRRQVNGKN